MSKPTVNLTVQIPRDLDDQIKEAAGKNLLSKSAFVRTALLAAARNKTIVNNDRSESVPQK